jgi:hypothetical protein
MRNHIIDCINKDYVIIQELDLRYGGAHGIWAGNANNLIIQSNDISFIGGGNQYGALETVRFGNGIELWENAKKCTIRKNRIWEIYDAALTNQGADTNVQSDIIFRNNIIWNSEYCYEYWNRPSSSFTLNIGFENNICADSGYGWGHIQRPDQSGRHLCLSLNQAEVINFSIKNNIFFEARQTGLYVSPYWNDIKSLDINFNNWFEEEGYFAIYQNQNFFLNDYKEYQNQMKQDNNSVFSDPLFISEETHDYHLSEGSPAIDKGLPIGLTVDYEGNEIPYGNGPDIGAYESPYASRENLNEQAIIQRIDEWTSGQLEMSELVLLISAWKKGISLPS